VIDRAIELGLRHLWLQEGSEEPRAIERAVRAGIEVIHGGPCLLIELARRSPARTETP
jgi:predicted CoA-binding protein